LAITIQVSFFSVGGSDTTNCCTHPYFGAMKTVLVVDDSATIRRMVKSSLRMLSDVEFREAGSGLDAIEKLAVGSAELIVLDLNMPDMHGMEVISFVRKHATFKSIPIIVLTTRGDDESRTAALAAGATQYMTKPFTPDALAECARRLLFGHGN
jgi:two-component system chemotaxis response regulator CheY